MNRNESSAERSERFSVGINDSYCPSCLAAIAPVVLRHKGITKITVFHARNQIVVEYLPDKISRYTLKRILESAITENIETNEGPTSAIDPVFKMLVKPDTDSLYSDHNGQCYYFCALSCKRAFDEAPTYFENISLTE